MKIPTWAERALEVCKPRAPSWSKDGPPDSTAVARWAAYTKRFRNRWHELQADKWKCQPGYTTDQTSYNILVSAIHCAKRLGNDQTPAKVVQARRDLLALDREISDLAAKLASKFRLRDGIEKDSGVASWRKGDFNSDPMDLWDAMEMAFNPHPGSGRELPQSDDVWEPLGKALCIARTTSLSVPEWPDILDVLGEHFEPGTCVGDFPDITAMGHETNKSEYSPWCKALIQLLHERNLLDCLKNPQLASLANVAFDAPGSDQINPKQIGALKKRFLER